MDKKKSIISAGGLLILILIAVLAYIFIPISDEKAPDPFGLKSIGKDKSQAKKKKEKKNYQTTYQLDELKFFALPDETRKTYVDIQVSLAFPMNDHETESEIIIKREQIKKFIKHHISQKSYYQLKEANKRESIKYELLERINKILKRPVQDIYFTKFFVMPRQKID
ncbi:MAG: flagellar basal body-associated FliL family protein [Spirochaetota bacterium]|nr:flagellar basal body-associated FliL family protein [Spirochaetota bacterium]